MKNKKIQFANLVLRTKSKVLLELYDSYVKPIFFGEGLIRSYGHTSYIFEDVALVNLGNEGEVFPAIVGRIVKDSQLKIEQKRVDGALISVDERHQTSPSAIFAIYLHNHRMIYVREHVGAPNLDTFKTVVEDFVKKIHKIIIDEKLNFMRKSNKKSKWKELGDEIRNNFELPSVNILPLVSARGMADAVMAMDVVKKISFQIIKPNDDANTNQFFDQIRMVGDELEGVEKSKTEFSAQEGSINNRKAADITMQAINDHNVIVAVSGEAGGKKIKCSNEMDDKAGSAMALTESVANADATPTQIAKQGLNSLGQMISSGVLNNIVVKGYEDFVVPLLRRILDRGVKDE